jgi:hypothetical protein
MRRQFASALALVLLIGTPTTPANALFGLSKCEKVKKEISKEEQVGLIYFKEFDRQRDLFLSNSSPTNQDYVDLLDLILDVYQSDKNVYLVVDKNKSCFSAKKLASARTRNSSVVSEIKSINNVNTTISKNSISTSFLKQKMNQELTKQTRDWAKKVYNHFLAFDSGKQLD